MRGAFNKVRIPFPWENVPRVCMNCGYRGKRKDSRKLFFQFDEPIKCPKCGKKKFILDPAVVF